MGHHQVLENFYQVLYHLAQETFLQVPHLQELGTLYQDRILEYPLGLHYLISDMFRQYIIHHHRQTLNSHKLIINPKITAR